MELVQISPMRSDAAEELGAEWLPLRPNTDTAVMLGLAHTLYADGLHDTEFLDRYCVGFDRFCAYLTGESDGVPKSARRVGQLRSAALTRRPFAPLLAEWLPRAPWSL